MKKKVTFVCLIILLTGCSRIDNTEDYKQLIMNCLKNDVVTNDVSLGYRFYVPRGVKLNKNIDYNQTLEFNNNKMFMYVDIVSYYYKNDTNFSSSTSNVYYYQKFDYNDKFGYIGIYKKEKDLYYVSIMYNYASMEFYTDKNNLNGMISVASIILNSIKYNDTTIENILKNNLGSYSDIKYKLDKPSDDSRDFSDILEEYVQDESDSAESLPDD